jgi:hypothetical protein
VGDAGLLPVDSFSVISKLAESLMSYEQKESFCLLACIPCKFTDGDSVCTLVYMR